jgi:hypothetical protein
LSAIRAASVALSLLFQSAGSVTVGVGVTVQHCAAMRKMKMSVREMVLRLISERELNFIFSP